MTSPIGTLRLAPQNFSPATLRITDASGNGITATAGTACNNLDKISFSIWFKPVNSTTSTARIFYKGNSSATQAWLDVYFAYSTGKISVQTGWTTQGIWNVQQILQLNQWHHIIVTYDDSNVANAPIVYLDGQIPSITVGQIAAGTRIADTTNLMIAKGAFSAVRYLPGIYANFRLYNRVITSIEADALYKYDVVPSGLVLEYFMDENTGSIVNDASGLSNGNGTVVGGTWINNDAPSQLRVSVI